MGMRAACMYIRFIQCPAFVDRCVFVNTRVWFMYIALLSLGRNMMIKSKLVRVYCVNCELSMHVDDVVWIHMRCAFPPLIVTYATAILWLVVNSRLALGVSDILFHSMCPVMPTFTPTKKWKKEHWIEIKRHWILLKEEILIDSGEKSSFQKLPSSFYELFINSWSSISNMQSSDTTHRHARTSRGKRQNGNSIWIQSANLKNNYFFLFSSLNTNGEGADMGNRVWMCVWKSDKESKGRKEREKK